MTVSWLVVGLLFYCLLKGHAEKIQEGYLLYHETDSGGSAIELWAGDEPTIITDPLAHDWNMATFLANGNSFWSHLVDQLGTMTITNIELLLLNDQGAVLGIASFLPQAFAALDDIFVTSSLYNRPAETVLTRDNKMLIIHNSADEDHISLGIFGSNLLVANTISKVLPLAEHVDCHGITLDGTEEVYLVDSVFECTQICISGTDDLLGVYTRTFVTHNEHVCLCNVTNTGLIDSTRCSETCPGDLASCGEPSTTDIGLIYLSVYNIANALMTMTPNHQTSELTVIRENNILVDLPGSLVVKKISAWTVDGDVFEFTLKYSKQSCTVNNLYTTLYGQAADGSGEFQVFASVVSQEIEPTRMKCMAVVTTPALTADISLTISYITDDFIVPKKMAIHAGWTIATTTAATATLATIHYGLPLPATTTSVSMCTGDFLFQDTAMFPDGNINIQYQDVPYNLADVFGNVGMTMKVSPDVTATMTFLISQTTDFWLTSLSVITSYPVNLDMVISTQRICTVDNKEVEFTQTLTTHVAAGSGNPTLSANLISLHEAGVTSSVCLHTVQMISTAPLSSSIYYSIDIQMMGCENDHSCLTPQNPFQGSLPAYIVTKAQWTPVPEETPDMLRPIGDGIFLYKMNNPTITVSFLPGFDIVSAVVLNGDVNTAIVVANGVEYDVTSIGLRSGAVLIFTPSLTLTNIIIRNFTSTPALAPYLHFVLDIELCTTGPGGVPLTCKHVCTPSIPLTVEQLDTKVKELEETLTVPKSNTSAAVRKKVCAEDRRSSSKAAGVVAIVILSMTGVSFVAMDAVHIINGVKYVMTVGKLLKGRLFPMKTP